MKKINRLLKHMSKGELSQVMGYAKNCRNVNKLLYGEKTYITEYQFIRIEEKLEEIKK